jgi:hypothetical protein
MFRTNIIHVSQEPSQEGVLFVGGSLIYCEIRSAGGNCHIWYTPGNDCLERRNHSFGMAGLIRLLARRLHRLTFCVPARLSKNCLRPGQRRKADQNLFDLLAVLLVTDDALILAKRVGKSTGLTRC